MNFDFSEDQKFIQEQARNFLASECDTARVRQTLEGEQAYDQALWQQIVELGWPATAISEDQGGLGLGYLELCVIAEELGRVVAPVPFIASVYLATEAIKLAADKAQQDTWLPQLAAGEWIGCLATQESAGALTTENLNTTVTDGSLSGKKTAVLHGEVADKAVVLAAEDGQPALYLVDLTAAGVTRKALTSIDPTLPLAELSFDQAPCEKLASSADTVAILSTLFDRAAVLLSFEQIGGCDAALNMGKEYTMGRYAFGRQVASFQAIKHKFADMFVATELARSNAYYGAWALSADDVELPLAAATARVSAIDAYYESSKENIQAHGGMGFTWEFDCHLYYRRAQALSLILGGNPQWKELLVERLLRIKAA
ncbi:alkylation response protein AidB-like acyl-CoA dehydrogenase [Litorivivens lipolytica]|uniref:Alkylation response protein AidB-like acyl-CoA dehydrogenase n=1 Tax=Litorivivens lipolytica TaxID=1524264 RepID=A0A7W4W4G4_9GAMM|nr:acyl-CoA dehydrogenase family protein [Litorivivens lipolytica]MBB3047257.1 alkylation response protein AidB-like acyl-CoA dehydrogenase [Litorivivens lipolytica]